MCLLRTIANEFLVGKWLRYNTNTSTKDVLATEDSDSLQVSSQISLPITDFTAITVS